MNDSWCRPCTAEDGKRLSGSAAREKRIKDRGGMDRILDEREMRGYRSGYGDGYRDARDEIEKQVEASEKRVSRAEKERRAEKAR